MNDSVHFLTLRKWMKSKKKYTFLVWFLLNKKDVSNERNLRLKKILLFAYKQDDDVQKNTMDNYRNACFALYWESHGNVLWCDNLPYFLLHFTTYYQLFHSKRTRRRRAWRGYDLGSINHTFQWNDHKSRKTSCPINDRSSDLVTNYICLFYGNYLYMF